MAFHRVFSSPALPSLVRVRLANQSTFFSPRLCFCCHILRLFTSGHFVQNFTKRKIQTSTACQPNVFVPQLPPTRVTGMPNISTGEIAAQRNLKSLPAQTDPHDLNFEILREEKASPGLSEDNERKPISITNIPASPETEARPKFKARKAAIKLTPGAVNQIRTLLDQPSPKLIKIGVRNRGCSGLTYHLEYVDKAGFLDEEVEQDGVKVIIDSKALFSIIGSEMDWIEDKLNQKFVFKNPNIKGQCGCETQRWHRAWRRLI